MNYTLQEYANDVVYHMQTVCDEAGVPHPTHHLRKRPRRGRVSQRAWSSARSASPSRGTVTEVPDQIPEDDEQPLHDLVDDLSRASPPATCWKATTTRSRRWTSR